MSGGILTDSVVQLIEGLRRDVQRVNDQVGTLTETVSKMAQTNEGRMTRLEADYDHIEAAVGDLKRGQERHGVSIGKLFDAEREEEAATAALTGASNRRSDARRWQVATLFAALGAVAALALVLVTVL